MVEDRKEDLALSEIDTSPKPATTPKVLTTISLWDLPESTSKTDITTRLKQQTQPKKVYNKPSTENSGLKSAYANESSLIDMLNNSNRTILIDIIAKAPDCDLINLYYTRLFMDIIVNFSNILIV